ncbi:MAG TPA: hypothetical protein VMY88_05495, partial [Acidimicrobiales bacterium]|nr:hypothetical protein [Acidimicrobiales bacterium]
MPRTVVKRRDYPPLVLAVGVMVLLLALFPSALNLPQTNPSETLEYAPVPPDDEAADEQLAGNLSSLSLAGGQSLAAGEEGEAAASLPADPAIARTPSSKRCVGRPPRQTPDPLSPPCVSYFRGDNFGSTYSGVTRDEIKVLFVLDANLGRTTDAGTEDETQYQGQYFDLGQPASDDENSVSLRNLRRFQRYFNERYQTYGRFVHFWAYFSTPAGGDRLGERTPETRRADAAENYSHLKPFTAMTTQLELGLGETYADAMAEHDVLLFGSESGNQPKAKYARYPGLIWSYTPTLERSADLYASYVCEKVIGQPVVDSGNAADMGKPRRLGLLRTTDATRPGLVALGKLVKQKIEACGGEFVEEATFDEVGYDLLGTDDPTPATANMARFQESGVTTVIWGGGHENKHSAAAARLGYLPEWILAGDTFSEGAGAGGDQNQTAWRYASIVTSATPVDKTEDTFCGGALREADPTIGGRDLFWGCLDVPWYPDIRQLFSGIQVAGPRLTPSAIDKGFHAIPAVASTSPDLPACFYEPGDYTCVKD